MLTEQRRHARQPRSPQPPRPVRQDLPAGRCDGTRIYGPLAIAWYPSHGRSSRHGQASAQSQRQDRAGILLACHDAKHCFAHANKLLEPAPLPKQVTAQGREHPRSSKQQSCACSTAPRRSSTHTACKKLGLGPEAFNHAHLQKSPAMRRTKNLLQCRRTPKPSSLAAAHRSVCPEALRAAQRRILLGPSKVM